MTGVQRDITPLPDLLDGHSTVCEPPWRPPPGVEGPAGVAKYLLAGADVVMLSVPLDADAAGYERAGYVTGLRTANVRAYSAW